MRTEDCKQNGDCRQGAFAARKQGDFRQLFARRTSNDLHARRQRIDALFVVIDLQFRFAAAEKFLKRNFEILVDLIEALVENTQHFPANLVKRRLQIVDRFLQIVALRDHLFTVRFFVFVFLHRVGIDRSEIGDFAL